VCPPQEKIYGQPKDSSETVKKQNARILLDLLNIEQRKVKKLKEMISAFKTEDYKKEQSYLEQIQKLEQIKYIPTKIPEKNAENGRIEIACKGLQTANNEIFRKIEQACEKNGSAREKLAIFDELLYWRQKYEDLRKTSYENNEEIKKLESDFEKYRKSAKKYKSAYLHLKKKAGKFDQLATMRTSMEKSPGMGNTILSSKSPSSPGSNRSEDFDREMMKANHEIMLMKKAIDKKTVDKRIRQKTKDNPINIV